MKETVIDVSEDGVTPELLQLLHQKAGPRYNTYQVPSRLALKTPDGWTVDMTDISEKYLMPHESEITVPEGGLPVISGGGIHSSLELEKVLIDPTFYMGAVVSVKKVEGKILAFFSKDSVKDPHLLRSLESGTIYLQTVSLTKNKLGPVNQLVSLIGWCYHPNPLPIGGQFCWDLLDVLWNVTKNKPTKDVFWSERTLRALLNYGNQIETVTYAVTKEVFGDAPCTRGANGALFRMVSPNVVEYQLPEQDTNTEKLVLRFEDRSTVRTFNFLLRGAK